MAAAAAVDLDVTPFTLLAEFCAPPLDAGISVLILCASVDEGAVATAGSEEPAPSMAVFATKSRSKLDVYCGIADGTPRQLSPSEPLSATRMIAAFTSAGSSLSDDDPASASGMATGCDEVREGPATACVDDGFAGVDADNGGIFASAPPSSLLVSESLESSLPSLLLLVETLRLAFFRLTNFCFF